MILDLVYKYILFKYWCMGATKQKKTKKKASAGGPDAQDKPTNQKRKTKNKKQKKQKEKQKKNNGGLVLCKNGSKKQKKQKNAPCFNIWKVYIIYKIQYYIYLFCCVVPYEK